MGRVQRFWGHLQSYRSHSLITKNFIVILVLFILPITGMGLLVYQNMSRIVEREISTISMDSLKNTKDTIDTVLRDADVIATHIAIRPSVKVFFMSDLPFDDKSIRYNEVYNQIKIFPFVHRYIDTIYVYSTKDNIVISTRESNHLSLFSDKSWYDEFNKRVGNQPWIAARKKSNIYPYYISVVRPAYLYDNQKFGAVIVNINIEELAEMIGKSNNQSEKDIFIIDNEGNVIFNYNLENITKNIKSISMFDEISLKADTESQIIMINGDKYVVSAILCPIRNWRYISFIPLHTYSEKVDWVENFILIFFFAGILAAVLISLFLSYKSFEPISKIIGLLESPDEWRKRESDRKTNEVEYIADHIVKMLSTNRQLQNELENRLALLDKAHTLALQAQINPHFLNNTLESINWLAALSMGKRNQVSEMIGNLSKLLRLSLETDEEVTKIENEIEHAKCYIEIMKVRYPSQFDVEWHIPSSMLDYKIIKLCLQPVIENALYHGLKHVKQDGRIKITGKVSETDIILEIQDNGTGLDEKQLMEINQTLEKNYVLKAEHIGLRNIAQRIKLVFGEEYGIVIERGQPEGLMARIRIPKIK